MPHNWIFNSDPEILRKMLEEIGVQSVEELFSDVPPSVRINRDLNVGFGKPLSEYEVVRHLKELAQRIYKPRIPPFCGIDVCYHYVPAVVKELTFRNEFYTAYTPYQPEINQGLLQALFEYQSLMAELYGVEVVNASMYDGSTALAEAVRMAIRITRRNRVLVSRGVSPIKRRVMETWLRGTGTRIEYIDLGNDGSTDEEKLKELVDNDVAAVVLEYPNTMGVVEDVKRSIEIVHEKGGLAIVFSNPIALGILKPPGELGADIVVGEGQPLGLGLYYGGSTLGILGTRNDMKFVRQLPGRLVGMTTTIDGSEIGFALVLQTREQHIRRERATSNITTNSALMAIAAAIYVSWLGGDGIRRLSLSIAARTKYLVQKLRDLPKDAVEAPLFEHALYFMKVPIKFKNVDCKAVQRRLREEFGILGFSHLGDYDPLLQGVATICVTEVHSKSDIDTLIDSLASILKSSR